MFGLIQIICLVGKKQLKKKLKKKTEKSFIK